MKDKDRPKLMDVIILDDLDKEILKQGRDEIQNLLLGRRFDENKIFRLIGWINIRVGVDYDEG
jgi:hypothetical protein